MPRISRLSISRNLNQIKEAPKRILNYITEDEQQKEERLMIHHILHSHLNIETKLKRKSMLM